MDRRLVNRWEDPRNPGHPMPGYQQKFLVRQESIQKLLSSNPAQRQDC